MITLDSLGKMCHEMMRDHEREYHYGQMEVEAVNECPEPASEPQPSLPIYQSIQEQCIAFLDDARMYLDFRLLRAIQCIVEGGVGGTDGRGDLDLIAEAIDQVRCFRDTKRHGIGWDRLRGMGINEVERAAKQALTDEETHGDPHTTRRW